MRPKAHGISRVDAALPAHARAYLSQPPRRASASTSLLPLRPTFSTDALPLSKCLLRVFLCVSASPRWKARRYDAAPSRSMK
jgi:hypothetical protein